MATWYAQLSATSFFSVSGGTTSNQWNAATNGSGAWLDLSADYSADTFNSNAKTTIAIDANVTAASLTSAAAAGTWTINTTGVTITANLVCGTAATFLMNSGTPTVTIVGNLAGGASSNDSCVDLSVAGTLNVTGDVTGGSAAAAYGINISAAATVNITGTVTGGSNVGAYGVHNGSTPSGVAISVTGSLVASTGNAVASLGSGAATLAVANGNIVDTATVNAFLMRAGTYSFDPGVGNYFRIRTTGATTVDLTEGTTSGAGAWAHRMIGGGF